MRKIFGEGKYIFFAEEKKTEKAKEENIWPRRRRRIMRMKTPGIGQYHMGPTTKNVHKKMNKTFHNTVYRLGPC